MFLFVIIVSEAFWSAQWHGCSIYTVFPLIVCARSIHFTVCVMRGLFEGAVYSEGANYSRKYNIYIFLAVRRAVNVLNVSMYI